MMRLVGILAFSLMISIGAIATPLKVGFATQEMKFPEGISLAGLFPRRTFSKPSSEYANYFKASKGVHDNARVKSVLIEDGNSKLVFASIDIVAIDPDMRLEVLKRLGGLIGPNDQLHLMATHTHSGPSSYSKVHFWEQFALDKYNKKIWEIMVTTIVDTVVQAHKNLLGARMEIASGKLDGVAFNRRNNPELNTELNVIKFVGQDNSIVGTLMFFPTHGTVMGPKNLHISGDLPSAYERQIEKLTGAPAIHFVSAAGDVGPRANESTFMEMDKLATVMAQQTIEILKDSKSTFGNRIVYADASSKLPRAFVNIPYCLDVFLPSSWEWFKSWFGRYKMPETFNLPIPIRAVSIGEIVFILVPAEPTTELGLKLEEIGRSHGFQKSIIMSLANSYHGYILSEADYKRGGYESCNSFYGSSYAQLFLKAVDTLFLNVKRAKGLD